MLTLKKNSKKYYNFIRKLRNDPENQIGFLEKKIITKDEQIKYMEKYSNCYYIALIDKKACGYIGVVDNDIRICVDRNFKNMGIGFFMLTEIIKLYPQSDAKILKKNENSLKLFFKCGFKIINEDENLIYLKHGI